MQISFDIDDVHQIAERLNIEPDYSAALVAGLNAYSLPQRTKILVLAAAITDGYGPRPGPQHPVHHRRGMARHDRWRDGDPGQRPGPRGQCQRPRRRLALTRPMSGHARWPAALVRQRAAGGAAERAGCGDGDAPSAKRTIADPGRDDEWGPAP